MRIIFTLLIALNIVYGAVSGIAFRDYNADGVKQDGEPGVGEIVVKVYSSSGAYLKEVTTDDAGKYSIDIPEFPVRLEFKLYA